MKIDFTPSAKTIVTMKKIHQLRLQSIYWEDVAKEIGYTPRYARALYKKYKEMVELANKLNQKQEVQV